MRKHILLLCTITLCVILIIVGITIQKSKSKYGWNEIRTADYPKSNSELAWDEFKAYFRKSCSLEYHPNIEEICEVVVDDEMIHMSFYDKKEYGYVYIKKRNIRKITAYLNNIVLVKAEEDELPNMSDNASISYYGAAGEEVQSFVIYGGIFIRDSNTDELYRIKYTGIGSVDIIEGLEKLEKDA